jgi:hypothetical protein
VVGVAIAAVGGDDTVVAAERGTVRWFLPPKGGVVAIARVGPDSFQTGVFGKVVQKMGCVSRNKTQMIGVEPLWST